MARTELVLDVAVVLRALVLVLDDQADRRAGCHALEHAGEYPDLVRFIALRRVTTAPWPATVQVRLDIGFGERHPRRAAVDDAAERQPVALAKGRHHEIAAKTVSGHLSPTLTSMIAQSHDRVRPASAGTHRCRPVRIPARRNQAAGMPPRERPGCCRPRTRVFHCPREIARHP